MQPKLFLAAASAAGAILAGSAAGAATFSVTGGTAYALPSDYDPSPGSPDLGIGTSVLRNAGLSLDGAARVSFSYVGTEAGYDNRFSVGGVEHFGNKAAGNAAFTLDLGAGLLPFSFSSVDPAGTASNGSPSGDGIHQSIALFQKSASVVYALFNDSATSDQDYDDMAVRMEIAPAPLPAAAWLLLSGIAGLGAMSRRRAALAAA